MNTTVMDFMVPAVSNHELFLFKINMADTHQFVKHLSKADARKRETLMVCSRIALSVVCGVHLCILGVRARFRTTYVFTEQNGSVLNRQQWQRQRAAPSTMSWHTVGNTIERNALRVCEWVCQYNLCTLHQIYDTIRMPACLCSVNFTTYALGPHSNWNHRPIEWGTNVCGEWERKSTKYAAVQRTRPTQIHATTPNTQQMDEFTKKCVLTNL